MVLASVLNGLGMALIGVIQPTYCSEASNSQNKGRIFGVFWSTFMGCHLFGNPAIAWSLKAWGAQGMFTFATILCCLALVLFIFVTKPTKEESSKSFELTNTSLNDILIMQKNLEEGLTHQENVKEDVSVAHTLSYLNNDGFKAVLPLTLISAFSICFYISFLSRMTATSVGELPMDDQTAKIGFSLFILGLSNVLGGQLFGNVLDKNKVSGVKLLYWINFGAFIAVFLAYVTGAYWIHIISASFLGFCDSGSQTVQGAILSMKFTDKVGAFALLRGMWNFYVAAFFLLNILFQEHLMLLLVLFLTIIIYGAGKIDELFSHY